MTEIPDCKLPVPYVEIFSPCGSVEEAGWTLIEPAAPAGNNWGCAWDSPLGPDSHLLLDFDSPPVEECETLLVSPRLDASSYPGLLTLQFDYAAEGIESGTTVAAAALLDLAGDGPDDSDPLLPLWSLAETGAPAAHGTTHVLLPEEVTFDRIHVAFHVDAGGTWGLDLFAIDDVRVCPGKAPDLEWPDPVQVAGDSVGSISFSFGGMWLLADPQLVLLSAPSFAEALPVEFSNDPDEGTATIILEPDLSDAGSYQVVYAITDGCISVTATLQVEVL